MKRFLLALLLTVLPANELGAQADLTKGTTAPPAEDGAIPLGTGGVPGMPPEIWFEGPRVRNVSRATLTPFLPDPTRATGAAVIVVPGGAFALLAIDKEGWSVARWFAARGIAAFVLKYRLRPTPADPAEAQRQRAAAMASGAPRDLSTPPHAIQDGRAALRLVRKRAAEWGVDPKRVGMLGFSAGAMTSLAVTLQATPDEMPSFVAPIYGPMAAVKAPDGVPPMFAAIAADDPLFGRDGFGLVHSWQAAGAPVEFHFYQRGGHGFGTGKEGTTTLGWLDAFHRWLDMNGFLSSRR